MRYLPQGNSFYFCGFYVWANFGKPHQEMRAVRMNADGHTDRGKLVYDLSYGVCYSYGTDNKASRGPSAKADPLVRLLARVITFTSEN